MAMKPVQRIKKSYSVQKDGHVFTWEMRETRKRRWYCFDHNGFCFAWSFTQDKALTKFREWAERNGYTITGCMVFQGVTVK